MHGHRIKFQTFVKFLCVVLDYKLLWKEHIKLVLNHCHLSLCPCLPQSKLYYGLAYVTASNSNLRKVDVTVKGILWIRDFEIFHSCR